MTLDGPWNLYWFQGVQKLTSEVEMEDFIARGMNLDIEFGSDCRMANVVTYNRNFSHAQSLKYISY